MSVLQRFWRRSIVLRGTLHPGAVAPYLRSARIQKGALRRSLFLPVFVVPAGVWALGMNDPHTVDDLSLGALITLVMVVVCAVTAVSTLVVGSLGWLLGRLIQVHALPYRKSLGITGWATLCSFLALIPLLALAAAFGLPDAWRAALQPLALWLYLSAGWRHAAKARVEHIVTLGCFLLVWLLGAQWLTNA